MAADISSFSEEKSLGPKGTPELNCDSVDLAFTLRKEGIRMKSILLLIALGLLVGGCHLNQVDPRQQIYNFRDCVDPTSITNQDQFDNDADECCRVANGRYYRLRNASVAIDAFDPRIRMIASDSAVGSPMVNALAVFKKCMKAKGYNLYEVKKN